MSGPHIHMSNGLKFTAAVTIGCLILWLGILLGETLDEAILSSDTMSELSFLKSRNELMGKLLSGKMRGMRLDEVESLVVEHAPEYQVVKSQNRLHIGKIVVNFEDGVFKSIE